MSIRRNKNRFIIILLVIGLLIGFSDLIKAETGNSIYCKKNEKVDNCFYI